MNKKFLVIEQNNKCVLRREAQPLSFRLIALMISLIVVGLSMGNKHQQQFLIQDIYTVNKMEFKGKIKEDKALSAVGLIGKYLLLGADEGRQIQVLERDRIQS